MEEQRKVVHLTTPQLRDSMTLRVMHTIVPDIPLVITSPIILLGARGAGERRPTLAALPVLQYGGENKSC